jgi:8-oxo-dGTP pyrophosphatase MutT (NUDIX family)
MGVGVLPACIKDNQIYFLFGKENKYNDTPGFSDFGGGKDNSETELQTAIREGKEEMTGFLGDMKPYLKKHYRLLYPKYNYTTLIFFFNYDEKLPIYFNNLQNFLHQKLDTKIIKESKIFEKCEMKWFSMNEMKKKRNLFRSFYREIVDELFSKQTEIKTFLEEPKLLKRNKSSTKKSKSTKKNKSN